MQRGDASLQHPLRRLGHVRVPIRWRHRSPATGHATRIAARSGAQRSSAPQPVLDEDEQSGAFHHTVYALAGGHLFGLHTHTQPASEAFDERRTGLDHVAFTCRGRKELQQWADRLTDLGISHDGIKDATYGSGVSFRAIPTESPLSSSRHPESTEP